MKLLGVIMLLTITAMAEAALDLTNMDIFNRKMKLAMDWGLIHPQPEKSSNNGYRLLEKLNAETNETAESGHDDADQGRDTSITSRNGNNHGSGIDSHHSIDLQTWNKQHPPKQGD